MFYLADLIRIMDHVMTIGKMEHCDDVHPQVSLLSWISELVDQADVSGGQQELDIWSDEHKWDARLLHYISQALLSGIQHVHPWSSAHL